MNRGRVDPPMASADSEERLQNITLGKIPIPEKSIDCQTLLRQHGVSHHGWLRRKKPGKFSTALSSILPSAMTWDQLYVVIYKGCMYFYSNEYEKKPLKAISLFGYTRVMRASELQLKQACGLWPFKVAYVLDEHDRVHYLSAPCEKEMMVWLKCIKLELYRANGVEFSDDSIIDEDINDLETPISTGNYFNRIKDLKQIKEAVEDDSDMDSEYDYIDTDEATEKSKFSDVSSISSNDLRSKVSKEKRVESPAAKPGKPLPKPPSKPQEKPSPGYYPSSIMNLTTPPASKENPPSRTTPFIAAKKVPSPPPNKPLHKQPPVTLPKGGGGGAGRDSPAKTPSGESFSVSVADLSKALNLVGKVPKPSAYASQSPPDHVALGETRSSSVAAAKPLPPIPAQVRGSNAPTAVVMPMRQPAATYQPSRFTQDLEASALWDQDSGEGQRLLMSLGVEGAYMLRSCSDGSQLLTLLAIADYQLRKYKVFKNEAGMLSLQTDFVPHFDSVHNLLNFYRTNFLPNRRTTLSQSYRELQRR